MTSRISTAFATVRAEGRAALIPFIMGYDPDAQTTASLLPALAESGADLIEIGIPFSDPMADGPVIQAAGLRALQSGGSVKNILALVAEFRQTNQHTPIILMGYFNPIYRYGAEAFAQAAAASGVDGLILVDLPPEEELEVAPALAQHNIALIRLVAPTSLHSRAALLVKHAEGFVYYISVAGITGAKTANTDALKEQLAQLRTALAGRSLPIAVGFGIKTAEQVAAIAKMADAVVVGSALVEHLHQAAQEKRNIPNAAKNFISTLKQALVQ